MLRGAEMDWQGLLRSTGFYWEALGGTGGATGRYWDILVAIGVYWEGYWGLLGCAERC